MVASTTAELLKGALLAPPNMDETGAFSKDPAWTGARGVDTCSDWTSSDRERRGRRGLPYEVGVPWEDDGISACSEGLRLYCYED